MQIKPLIFALAVAMLILITGPGCSRLYMGEITLVKRGKPVATIVIADEPMRIAAATEKHTEKHTVAYAADELQYFIEQACGVKLPIVKASEAPTKGKLICVGKSQLTDRYGLEPPTKPEALRVTTFKRGLAFMGEIAPAGMNNIDHAQDRGTLFGIYEFLNRQLGYRFYIHIKDDPLFGIVVPDLKGKRLTVPCDYHLDLAPDFQHRSAGFASWSSILWLRVTREGSATAFHANHTDSHLGRVYGKSHPEFMRLKIDGTRDTFHPCYSAPGLVNERVKLIKTFYETGKWGIGWNPPRPKYIPIVPTDWFGYNCQCERCKKAIRPEKGRWGRESDIIFAHGAAVARQIKEIYPDRRISMLAYESYMETPDIEIPDNLDVMICPMLSVSNGKEPAIHKKNMELLRAWSKKLGGQRDRLYIWNYYCWPAQFTEAPTFFPHYLQKWLQESHALSNGEFINPGSNPPQFEIFMCWLWHRLLWDRFADVDALLSDFTTQFFGPAAEPIEQLHRLLIDRWENVQWNDPAVDFYVSPDLIYKQTYPPEIIDQIKQLLIRAQAAAPTDPENIYHRRTLWMAKGFQPFLKEATTVVKWLDHPRSYTVTRAAKAPQVSAEWEKVDVTTLLEGKNGDKAKRATTIAMVNVGPMVHMRFVCEEAGGVVKQDRLTVRFHPHGRNEALEFALSPEDKTTTGTLKTTVINNTFVDGNWIVETTFTGEDISLAQNKNGAIPAQITRHHHPRDNEKPDWRGKRYPGTYIWMPRLDVSWRGTNRLGVIRFENE